MKRGLTMNSDNANHKSILVRSVELLKSNNIIHQGYAIFILARIAIHFRILRMSPTQRVFWYYALHNATDRILSGLNGDMPPYMLRGGQPSDTRKLIENLAKKDII